VDNIYNVIPVIENENFILRAIDAERDLNNLFAVYSDEKAVPLFNSDNCHGDNFYYTTPERMKEAIDFWNIEYQKKYYVRMAAEDKATHTAIGTIELFNRRSDDYYNNCGLLRLDLRSDYETEAAVISILDIIVPRAKELFSCDFIATKAVPAAEKRISALKKYGFRLSEHYLIGNDGKKYGSYYVMNL